MEAIEQVPKTALDVFRMLPEGTLCEVIDNVLYMSPAPKYNHQKLVLLFSQRIANYLDKTKRGIIAISPVDVYFEELASAVQPDILYLSNENMQVLHDDGYFYGAPDIIIEVLSSNKNRDRIQKKSLYERAGVKEYFIVNPTNRNVLQFQLEQGVYELVYNEDGRFASLILGLEFRF